MNFSFHRIYRNLPFIWIFIFLILGFGLYARGYSGYVVDKERLSVLCDLIMSAGILLVGIPLLLRMSVPDSLLNTRRSGFQISSFIFQLLTVFMSIWFLFFYHNRGFFGFIQAPEQGQSLFLLILLSSLTVSGLSVLERFLLLRQRPSIFVQVPFTFIASAVGVAISLFFFQVVSTISGENSFYDAVLPIYDFFKQLLLVAAIVGTLGQMILSLKLDLRRKLMISLSFFAGLLLLGFQSLGQSSSGSIFFLNQISTTIGLAGIVSLTIFVLMRTWKVSSRDIVNSGQWLIHFVFLLSLVLTTLTSLSAGRFLLAEGVLDNIKFGLLFFAIPFLSVRFSDHKPLYSQVAGSIIFAMTGIGVFVFTLSFFTMALYGASVGLLDYAPFKPFFGIAMTGLFMLCVAYGMALWDRILAEV